MSRWARADYDAWARRRLARHKAEGDFATELDRQAQTAPPRPQDRPLPRPAPAGYLYPLVQLCIAHGLPEPRPEFEFHPLRRWRFDYAWPAKLIAVEIDGGVWTSGRHVRGQGFIEDQRKQNAAALLGWRILRYTPDRLGEAVGDLRGVLL